MKRWLEILGGGMVKNGCGQRIEFIWRMNGWNKLIQVLIMICVLVQVQPSSFNDSCVSVFENGDGILVHETLKSALSLKWMNWADFLNANTDEIIFG